MGTDGLATVLRVGRLTADGFDLLLGRGGPVARSRSVAEFGSRWRLQPGVPSGANVTSVLQCTRALWASPNFQLNLGELGTK
jgi:hypothetical protein